jgi:hypothetical protein
VIILQTETLLLSSIKIFKQVKFIIIGKIFKTKPLLYENLPQDFSLFNNKKHQNYLNQRASLLDVACFLFILYQLFLKALIFGLILNQISLQNNLYNLKEINHEIFY